MSLKMKQDALAMIEYRHEPAVLVLVDTAAALERARALAERAGCRVADAIAFEGAVERIDRQVAAAAVIAELDEGHGEALDRLEASARGGRHASVISAPAALIDVIAARAWHSRVTHLSAPSEFDRVVAIALA